MKGPKFLFCVLYALVAVSLYAESTSGIKHVNGCLPDATGCSNHMDPQDTTTPSVTVDDTAVYVQVDPHHSIAWTTTQVYGYPKDVVPPEGSPRTMDGFITAYSDNFDNAEQGAEIMKCFSPEHVPVIANLSMEFGFFDGWHASVPGPTMVNRAYAASGTSHGMGTNDEISIIKGYPQKTMFRQLLEMGLDYRVYFHDVPSVLQFKEMRRKEARSKYRLMDKLFEDLQTGDMPEFSWIDPAYFTTMNQVANDQHPDHDVSEGETLIKEIYEALRASPIWEESVLLITYDEHGGFFDHVPPTENVPNPDGLNATDDPFDFTRLGVRVPAVVVSPWVKKGSVFHAPPDDIQEDGYAAGQYEHSSIVSTIIHKLFTPKEGFPAPEYLTKRDAWAKTFEWIFNTGNEKGQERGPRKDCPLHTAEVFNERKAFPHISYAASDGSLPLSHLQKELVLLMAGVSGDAAPGMDKWTEGEGGEYCLQKAKDFLMK